VQRAVEHGSVPEELGIDCSLDAIDNKLVYSIYYSASVGKMLPDS